MMNRFLEGLKNYLLSDGVDLVRSISIVLLGYMVIKIFIRYLKKRVNKSKRVEKTIPNFIISIVNIALTGILVIYALTLCGVSPDAVVTIASVFSLGISLALQDTISSLANGIIIIVTKPFVEGEYCLIGSIEGTVVSISMFNTVLKTADGMMITLPNSNVTKNEITNYSRLPTRRIVFDIPVGYNTDVDQLKKVVLDVVNSNENILKEPAPYVALLSYGDSNLNFSLRAWTTTSIYWDVRFKVIEDILQALRKANISIDYNQYDIHIKDINGLVKGGEKHE